MARIRTIKPEFFTSEQIAECSTSARLLFVGMWCFCDDQGVHPASAKRLKMEIYPGDDFTTNDISAMVEELEEAGLIRTFEVDGERYWAVTGWKHQKIERPNAKYPRPPFDEDSPTDRRQDGDDSPSDHPRKGMEGKGVNTDTSLRSVSCAPEIEKSEIVVAPDPPPKAESWLDAACRDVIGHLNAVCGKRFDPHKNLRARLAEFKAPERDVGLRVCRLVIEHKFAEWGKDDRMRAYLRPETLFRASHWQSYTQAAMEWDEAGRPSLERTSAKRGGRQTPEDILAMAGGAA